jgi:hypothetical protein
MKGKNGTDHMLKNAKGLLADSLSKGNVAVDLLAPASPTPSRPS